MARVKKSDIRPLSDFIKEECTECVCFERCDKTEKTIKACPKYFNWTIGFHSFITDNLRAERRKRLESDQI